MKAHANILALAGMLVLGPAVEAQTTTTISGFAPSTFGDRILTLTPGNSTNSVSVIAVFGSNGETYTLGGGGSAGDRTGFTYAVTGPNTATITRGATGNAPAAATNITFTGANTGTFSTMSGTQRSTGSFRLAEIPSAPALENLSVRINLSTGETSTVGFVVGGAMPRQVLVRAIGPGLAAFGVSSALPNPALTVYSGARAIATNDDWRTAATVSGGGSGTGSTSGTGTGTGTSGTGATGSSGSGMGGTGTGSGTTVRSNVTSALATSSMFAQVGAFGLANDSRDAATTLTLTPGAYTVQVSSSTTSTAVTGTGATGASGDVLIEVYFVE